MVFGKLEKGGVTAEKHSSLGTRFSIITAASRFLTREQKASRLGWAFSSCTGF
jgi:hypothetical protein